MYIWELEQWKSGAYPDFHWQETELEKIRALIDERQNHILDQHRRHLMEGSRGPRPELDAAQLDALVQSALRTSEIEGEILNAESVRSSMIVTLGMDNAGQPKNAKDGTVQTDALAKLLIEATTQHNTKISIASLCRWQAQLFSDESSLSPVIAGQLRGDSPMQVVSGRIDRPIVHFEAPPRHTLTAELQRFIHWFNEPPAKLDPLLRAAITHLWLVTLHPFDDGNGRVTRALTDRALAQADGTSIRYYSHSASIMARRREYYDVLQRTQSGSLDISDWLSWFMSVLADAMEEGQLRFQRVLDKTRFWHCHAQTALTERQIKVLNRLLDTRGVEFTLGINASKYQSLAKVSKATATRELADLLRKDCLRKLPGGGRSTRYELAIDETAPS